MGFPGGSAVKNLPAMQETWVRSLGREDLLEEGMATHSSTLAWELPWTGARQAIVHRIAQSRTRLKHVNSGSRGPARALVSFISRWQDSHVRTCSQKKQCGVCFLGSPFEISHPAARPVSFSSKGYQVPWVCPSFDFINQPW